MNARSALKRLLHRTGYSLHRWPSPFVPAEQLRLLFARHHVDCVLDVGANRGQYALELREMGYTGLILSFEPNPALTAVLERARASDPRWHVEAVALSDAEGTLTLHVTEADNLASALPPSAYAQATFGAHATVARTETVPVHRLDALLPRLQERFGFERPFLKMDTQGLDLRVLRGAEGVWPQLTGVQTEVSLKPLYDEMPDVTASLNAVRAAGFDVVGLYPVYYDAMGALAEMDCVAQRAHPAPANPSGRPDAGAA